MSETRNAPTILFFDGYCKLCNGLVDFLIRRDNSKRILFAPLSGETAKEYLSEELINKADTVVLYYQQRLYLKSTAALWALSLLGGAWKAFLLFFVFPNFIRDPFYSLIAKYRYRLFGKNETCRLPTKEEESRFMN